MDGRTFLGVWEVPRTLALAPCPPSAAADLRAASSVAVVVAAWSASGGTNGLLAGTRSSSRECAKKQIFRARSYSTACPLARLRSAGGGYELPSVTAGGAPLSMFCADRMMCYPAAWPVLDMCTVLTQR